MKRVKTLLLIVIGIILLILISVSIYKQMNKPSFSTFPAKVNEIKQAVKLSTLDITTDEIYKDTINYKGVVLKVQARVYISFDIEHIPMIEQGDTLIIQLPRETIDIYESSHNGYQVLDVWDIRFPENWVDTPLSSSEENAIKRKLKQQIENQMYEKGYVKRARENAVNSLSVLFSKFKDHIIIMDYYPDGWRNNELPPLFIEKPLLQLDN